MDNKFIVLILKMVSSEFSGNELKVFCILLKYMNSNYECYPSVRTISEKYKMSKETVNNCIKSLEAKKVIIKQKRKGTSNLYKIHKDYIVEKKKKKISMIPEWFNKNIKKEDLAKEEKLEMEEILKQYQ